MVNTVEYSQRMPLPVPSPSRLPRQSANSSPPTTTTIRRVSPPTSRPGSSSKSKMMPFSSSGNTRPSPPRPVSMFNVGNESMDLLGPDDNSRMPPPPMPSSGRTMSMRSNISNSSTTSKGKSKKSDEPKKHKGLGKMLSLRSHNKPESPDKKKGEESSSRLGRAMSMTFRSSKGDSEKDKEKEKKTVEPRGLLGRTMSLRTHKSSIGSTKSNAAAAAAAAVPNGLAKAGRLRPNSVYGGSTTSLSKLGVEPISSATASVARRPTVGSIPVAPGKSHRRSASTVSTTSITAPSNSRPGTANKTNTTPPAGNSKRPPFSSFNQEYPQPAPSGPSPRSRIIPPPPLDTNTIHQQTQLLQLLTLHSSSGQVYQELIASATTILKSRFEQLSARHYDVRETSIKKQNRANLGSLALIVNTGSIPDNRRQTIKSPEELIQAFSEGIKRTDALKAGDFRKLSATFGDWISGYNSSAAGREKWVDGIGENWRYDCDTVERKLQAAIKGIEGVRELFGALGDDDAVKTTVQRVAEGYVLLAGGMLEEVEMMRRMENEVVLKERRALRERVENIMTEDVKPKEMGIWAR